MTGMTFTKVSNTLRSNPRWLPLSNDGKALWLAGLMFAVDQETDGVIHRVQLPLVDPYHPTREEAATELVEAGLWEVNPDGWVISRFADHNLTADQKRFGKAAAAARQARSRAARTAIPEPCHTDVTRESRVTGCDTETVSRVTNEKSRVESKSKRERESKRERGVQGGDPTGDTPPAPPQRHPPLVVNGTTLYTWWRATRANLFPTELEPQPRTITRDKQAAQNLWDLIARNGDPNTPTEAQQVIIWASTHRHWGDRVVTLTGVLNNWAEMSAGWRKQHTTTTTTAPAARVAPAADLAALVAQIGPKP